jgi:translation elongation factor EF-Tu-like GTPase
MPHVQGDAGSGSTRFVAELQLSTDHGRPIFSGYRPTVQFGADQTRAIITLDPPSAVVAPGETVECLVDLVNTLPVVEGTAFTIVERRVVAGRGTVRVLLQP